MVTVKGPASCVAAAVLMIKDNVENFESQITDSVDIDKIHHRVIIGQGGKQVQEVRCKHQFSIRKIIIFKGRFTIRKLFKSTFYYRSFACKRFVCERLADSLG